MAAEAVTNYKDNQQMSLSAVSSAPEDQRFCNKNKRVKLKHPDTFKPEDRNLIEDSINNNLPNNHSSNRHRRKVLVR